MQKTSFVILLLLCLAHVSYGFDARGLLQSRSRSSSFASASGGSGGGSVSASASARSTGGTATAVAEATSEAFTEVENKLVKFFKRAFNTYTYPAYNGNDDEFCFNALSVIEKDLVAVGEVAAEAYASAVADVRVTGSGEACAEAQASARSQAKGYVKIIARAVAKATNRYTRTRAEAIVRQRLDVLATAFASAFAQACARDGGNALAITDSFGRASIYPMASLTLELVAGAECDNVGGFEQTTIEAHNTFSDSAEADTTSSVTAEGDAEGTAGGDAGAGSATACTGKYRRCCNLKNSRRCKCGRFNPCRAIRESRNPLIWFDRRANVRCFC